MSYVEAKASVSVNKESARIFSLKSSEQNGVYIFGQTAPLSSRHYDIFCNCIVKSLSMFSRMCHIRFVIEKCGT